MFEFHTSIEAVVGPPSERVEQSTSVAVGAAVGTCLQCAAQNRIAVVFNSVKGLRGRRSVWTSSESQAPMRFRAPARKRWSLQIVVTAMHWAALYRADLGELRPCWAWRESAAPGRCRVANDEPRHAHGKARGQKRCAAGHWALPPHLRFAEDILCQLLPRSEVGPPGTPAAYRLS